MPSFVISLQMAMGSALVKPCDEWDHYHPPLAGKCLVEAGLWRDSGYQGSLSRMSWATALLTTYLQFRELILRMPDYDAGNRVNLLRHLQHFFSTKNAAASRMLPPEQIFSKSLSLLLNDVGGRNQNLCQVYIWKRERWRERRLRTGGWVGEGGNGGTMKEER